MPAEETGGVVVLTWTLDTITDARELQDAMFDLGVTCMVQRNPLAPAEMQLQLQAFTPESRLGPLLVDRFGTRVRTVTLDGALVSMEKLPDEEG